MPAPFAHCYRQAGRPFVRGEGCRLYDDQGRAYLDLAAGIAVSALGHCHPELTEAVKEQCERLIHVSNLFLAPPVARAAELLVDRSGFDRVFFSNSGTEANEATLKLCRRYFQELKGERRFRFVAAEKSFHGRTFGSLSITGNPNYHKGFEPMLPGARFVPYGSVEALEQAVDDETAAIVLEPIQGEGGVQPPPEGYLEAARRIADERGCLLVFDEIQTGVGRTGSFLACHGFGVRPDVLTLAKGIAGGLPLGAMLLREELSPALPPGTHMTTFGGNPVACAAAEVVVRKTSEPGFLESVRAMGERMADGLRDGLEGVDRVLDVRGRGLLLGVALDRPAKPYMQALLEDGVLTTVAGGTVLRLTPPLVIKEAEVDEGVERVVAALKQDLRTS